MRVTTFNRVSINNGRPSDGTPCPAYGDTIDDDFDDLGMRNFQCQVAPLLMMHHVPGEPARLTRIVPVAERLV